MAGSPLDDVVAGVRRSIGGAIFERIAGPDGADGAPAAPPARTPSGGSSRAARSPASTATRRCSSAGSAPCCCSRCTRWRWPASRSTPATAATRGAGWPAPATSSPSRRSGRPRTPGGRSTSCAPCTAASTGTAPDGRPYAASDPHLLSWVHLAEVDSFLRALPALRRRAADRRRGRRVRRPERPRRRRPRRRRRARTRSPSASASCEAYRPELAGTPAARSTARFLVANPPLPLRAAPGLPADRRRRRLPAAALGPLAAAPAVAPRHRGHRRPRRRRGRHPHDPLGPARPPDASDAPRSR